VAATGVAFGQPWWLATMWGVLGVANIASGIAMMRAGEPWRSKYPMRWFPFWPPDER
jgi:hypothetical protein